MNLPKGPDTLCFDKDEFMKVRSPAPGRGWPALLALWGLSSGFSCPGALGGDLAAVRREFLGLGFGRRSLERALQGNRAY